MIENEFRVRPVTRYVVTHYHRDEHGAGCSQMGEFANLAQAETVARGLHQLTPGSTFATIGHDEPAPPPYAPQRPQVGDRIIVNAPELTTEATVEAVHEWKDRRLLDVYFEPGTYFHGFGGGQVVDNGSGPYLLEPRSILKD